MIRADYHDRALTHEERLSRADRIAAAISEGVAMGFVVLTLLGYIAKCGGWL